MMPSTPLGVGKADGVRRAPIRESILDFVIEPRTASEIAAHINRPIPTATGHLRAALQLGLVKRLARSIYVISAFQGPAPVAARHGQSRSSLECGLRRRLLNLLADRHTMPALARLTGASIEDIGQEMARFWRHGFLDGNPETGFKLREHVIRRYVRPVRNQPA